MIAVSRERDTFCLDFMLWVGPAAFAETARIIFGWYSLWDFTLKKIVLEKNRVSSSLVYFSSVGGGGTAQTILCPKQHSTEGAADSRATINS